MGTPIVLIVCCLILACTSSAPLAGESLRLGFPHTPLEQAQLREDLAVGEGQLWCSAAGEGIRLAVQRPYARAGERWVDGALEVMHRGTPLEGMRVRARLYALGETRPVAEISAAPERDAGRIWVDLRRHGLSDARLSVALLQEGEEKGVAEAFLSARPCETPLHPEHRIPVHIDVPEELGPVRSWPVTFGVPFPAGALWEADGLRLVDGEAKEIPSQKEVAGLWGMEGSVKWVRFDALVSSQDGCSVEVASPGAGAEPVARVTVAQDSGRLVLDTGAARYVLGRGVSPIHEVWLGKARVASSSGVRGLYVIDQEGRMASASADGETVEVEARGPAAACVRFEGFYRTAEGESLARYITRVEGFAGHAFANVTHTLTLTRSTEQVWFREIGWELAVVPGRDPRAVFNVSRDEPARTVSRALGEGVRSVHMVQEDGLRLGVRPARPMSIPWTAAPRGTNRCAVVAEGRDGASTLFTGEEMGDWAALAGERAGLMLSCREAARQHPKAFEVRGDRIVLHLFSNRAGGELDFRIETLMEKWGLKDLEPDCIDPERLEAVSRLKSDAVGWSKTHEMLVGPLASGWLKDAAARLCELGRRRVYAHVDPRWIYRTGALGPLHPRDPERFPAAEKAIDACFRSRQEGVPGEVYRGFMDFYAGPHFAKHRDRWRETSSFLTDSWRLYARSADRSLREFAEGANRAFMDNCVAHWDGERKKRGLFIGAGPGVLPGTGTGAFPLYWESFPVFSANLTSVDRSVLDYYLTGYRRGKDIVLQYAEALKREWKPGPEGGAGRGRLILILRGLLQAYGFTWDPYLRAQAEATLTRGIYDPEGEVLLTKRRAYGSTTYKTRTDQDVFVEAWDLIGGRRSYDIAMKLGRHHWNQSGVMGRISGITAHFLYRETQDPSIAAGLDHFMRGAGALYDAKAGRTRTERSGWPGLARLFQGLPAAMDVMAQSGADREWLVAWLDFAHDRGPVSIFALKGDEEALDLTVRGAYLMGETPVGVLVDLGGAVRLVVHAAAEREWAGKDLHQVRQISGGVSHVRIPKDAPGGLYEVVMTDPALVGEEVRLVEQRPIVQTGKGAKTVIADGRAPMVLHAPNGWQPARLRPVPGVYFNLPEGTREGRITFEGSARLFSPGGVPFKGGKPLRGSVPLPADRPGLWSFETVEAGTVRGEGFPPYFAMGDPEFYFDPEPLMRRP